MAANYYSIENIIDIAKITQVLARWDIMRNKTFRNGTRMPDLLLPQWLYTERKSLEWLYDTYPNDTRLPVIATYVYALCGNYVSAALRYLGGGGGMVLNPSTGQPLSLEVYRDDFIIDGVPAPEFTLVAGDSTYTIPLTNIIRNSVDWYPSGSLESMGITDRATINSVTYTKDYAIISLNQPVAAGEQYTVKALRSATGTSSAGGGGSTLPIPLPLQKGAYLTNTGTVLRWDSPEIKYTSASFDADGITVTDARLAIHDYDLYLELPTVLLDSTQYTPILSGGFTIIIPGFNANSNDYILTARMKQSTT